MGQSAALTARFLKHSPIPLPAVTGLPATPPLREEGRVLLWWTRADAAAGPSGGVISGEESTNTQKPQTGVGGKERKVAL